MNTFVTTLTRPAAHQIIQEWTADCADDVAALFFKVMLPGELLTIEQVLS